MRRVAIRMDRFLIITNKEKDKKLKVTNKIVAYMNRQDVQPCFQVYPLCEDVPR